MHFYQELVSKASHKMKKEASHYPLSFIINTDGVAVLYTALPNRLISQNGTPYERIKDCFTAVLIMFADSSKASLTIIG